MAPLQQLNLKVPPAVLDHWRAQAAAQGLSVRDWLVSIAGPTAAPEPGSAAGDGLADRVAQLEATAAELRESLSRLQQARPTAICRGNGGDPPLSRLQQARPPRSPQPAPPAPSAAPVPPPAGLAVDGIETAALAQLLGLKRGTLNARISRMGGAAPGLVVDGWRCLGSRTPERGGPPRALWVPADT